MSNKIHIVVKTNAIAKDEWVGHFESQVKEKVDKLKRDLLRAVRNKFGVHDPWKASKPGDYPYRLSGAGRRAIVIQDLPLKNVRGFRITTEGAHHDRLAALKRGFAITSKGRKPLAIPVSFTARNAAARGIGPRQAFGDRLILIFRTLGKRKVGLLVEKSVGHRTMMSRIPNASKKNILGMPRYMQQASDVQPGAVVHYVLKFGTMRILPRKGLGDAVAESMPLIASSLGGNWT